jgi:hypothetical protein
MAMLPRLAQLAVRSKNNIQIRNNAPKLKHRKISSIS